MSSWTSRFCSFVQIFRLQIPMGDAGDLFVNILQYLGDLPQKQAVKPHGLVIDLVGGTVFQPAAQIGAGHFLHDQHIRTGSGVIPVVIELGDTIRALGDPKHHLRKLAGK